MSVVPSPPFTLDAGTLFSLGVAFSLMPAAQVLAAFLLPKNISTKYKCLFLWHAYDALTHFIVEGSYLYHCFFSYVELAPPTADYPHPASFTPNGVHFLGQPNRRYGAMFSRASEAPFMHSFARLWMEYAKADHRWAGADLGIISLELLTVLVVGPCSAYICYLVAKVSKMPPGTSKASLTGRLWVVAMIVAVSELYGGFITFAPEWLSGNTNLRGDDLVYLILYLTFFNMLWVIIPIWVIWVAFQDITKTFKMAATSTGARKGL